MRNIQYYAGALLRNKYKNSTETQATTAERGGVFLDADLHWIYTDFILCGWEMKTAMGLTHTYYLENQLAFHPKFRHLIACRLFSCLYHPIA